MNFISLERGQLRLAVLVALLSWTSLTCVAQTAGTFTAAGNMTTARASHTETLLPSGKVLITGGVQQTFPSTILASAELYDPATGSFAPTGDMSTPRHGHTAVLLADGRVLIAGGQNATQDLTTAEVYDPSTGTFGPAVDLSAAIGGLDIAVLLADGRVLLTGCAVPCNSAIAEIYDPVAETFSPTGVPIAVGTPTLLADGRVLVTGGDCAPDGSAGAQVFDSSTGMFSDTGRLPHACDDINMATLLMNGQVLLISNDDNDGLPADAALYDPAAGAFTSLGHTTGPHEYAAAALLPDGTALLTGGQLPGGNGDTVSELYAPRSGAFAVTPNMLTGRHEHTATLLADGTVLIAGGYNIWPGPTSSAELYHPATPVPAPLLFTVAVNAPGQGAIWHADSGEIADADTPAAAGEALSMYTTSLFEGGVIPPLMSIGGRPAQILYFGDAPGFPGYNQVNFRVPSGVTPGPAVSVRLTYLGRSTNSVTIGVQ
jgi:hypothetical protein